MSTNPREPARRPRPLAAVPNRAPSPAPEVSDSRIIKAKQAAQASETSQRMARPRPNGEISQRIQRQPEQAVSNSRALAVEANLKKLRGYRTDDLMAVAELGYHYLFSGGYNLALSLFEGLQAIDPNEGYFACALGLTHDHLGNLEEAESWYRRAAALDPTDPRPDVNRAELRILRRDFAKARELLIRGSNKARAHQDQALETKARALLQHLSNSA